MDQMTVHVDQGHLNAVIHDQMVVPDLVVHGSRLGVFRWHGKSNLESFSSESPVCCLLTQPMWVAVLDQARVAMV